MTAIVLTVSLALAAVTGLWLRYEIRAYQREQQVHQPKPARARGR